MKFSINILYFFSALLLTSILNGQSNTCLSFDGQNDYIQFGDIHNLGTSDFTIESWIFISSAEGIGNKIINKGLTSIANPPNAGYALRANRDQAPDEIEMQIGHSNGQTRRLRYNGIKFNRWHHVAGVRSGNVLLLYLDGQLVVSDTTDFIYNVDTDIPLAIGAIEKKRTPTAEFMAGKIDEVRIWCRALSQTEIQKNSQYAITNSRPGLLAVFGFNEGQGLTAANALSNDNRVGLLKNGPNWESSPVALQCPEDDINCQEDSGNINSNLTISLSPKAEAGKDAYIQKQFPNINFGNEVNLFIGQDTLNSATDSLRSFIDFDLSFLPKGTIVNNAQLILRPKTLAFEDTILLSRIIEQWEESTITWDNQPPIDSASKTKVFIQFTPDTINQVQFLPVTKLVQDMIDHPKNSHGFRIQPGTKTTRLNYGSSDEKDWGFHPSLAIEVRLGIPSEPVRDTIQIEEVVQVFDTITQIENITVTDTLLIDFDIINSTNQISQIKIKVYPNPSRNLLFLEIPQNGSVIDTYRATISDLQGRIIFESTLDRSLFSINLADFGNPGLYFLVIQDREGRLISQKKIILQDD
ncbi:MAG: hypothetical protein Sapg2KO_20390 [Saprospiraceae bacterium]